jgi:AbrB family looped-hinge helix DNA binding protein
MAKYYSMSQIHKYVMTKRARARINQNGRIVIPASFRKALGIRTGDVIVMSLEDEELRISTIKGRIEEAQRRARKYLKPGTSLVDELIAERREEARREEMRP